MNPAEALIRADITLRGPISFARFMELALYSPECGYYETHSRTIGRSGDYFTSVSVGDVFGQILGSQLAHWLGSMQPSNCHLVEAGAHDGQLAADILSWLEKHESDLFSRLSYWIIEPSSRRREWQIQRLQSWQNRIHWVPHVTELPPFQGVFLCNEFLDAFPVHRFGWNSAEARWEEWGVRDRSGMLEWMRLPQPTLAIEKAIVQAGLTLSSDILKVLPDGFILEFSPSACEWWSNIAARLKRGWLVTSDYGFTAEEIIRPERQRGSARAYREHRLVEDLLASPGEQDLTAHVNFAAIQRAGESAGLRTEGLSRQGTFLSRAVQSELERVGNLPWTSAQRRQFQTLVHPEHLGHTFRILVQSRM